MARDQRDLKREQTGRRHLERQKASGQTVRGYCFNRNLPEAAFHYWRRTVAERDAATTRSAVVVPTFVPVTVVAAPASGTGSPIEGYRTDGRRVRVRTGCDRELLA